MPSGLKGTCWLSIYYYMLYVCLSLN